MDRKDKDKEDLTDYLLAKRKEQPKNQSNRNNHHNQHSYLVKTLNNY